MNKFILAAADDGSLSFTPPPSDYSVVFLSNIFGVVDGVLHGTGSQIMGSMFAVFNAAVLALGGIVIMYTLIVSTMNTAHEGQMLGQKWSSIWVPVRATVGLALLIPKASGYCLMQIFVMWVVVQGVGAADKVWNAALDYLNRGGVVVQAQMDPTVPMMTAGTSSVPAAAQVMLAGEVCMLGLQSQLENQLQQYQASKQKGTGPCSGTPTAAMQPFCTSTVPNFINSVNVVAVQNNNPTGPSYSVTMPNFDSTSPYYFLNGICGTLTWNVFPPSELSQVQQNIPSIQQSDLNTASMSRVIAIQQMYMDLATVAQVIVNNDPALSNQSPNSNSGSGTTTNFATFAASQFGVPQTATGTVCTDNTTPNCITWGGISGSSTAPLLNGTEFPGAIQDYNGIMLPTLNLIQQAQNSQTAQDSRAFIQSATTEGWIMAGSYFFNLVKLNVQASQGNSSNLTDSNTGLGNSSFSTSTLTEAFNISGTGTTCANPNTANLCTWMSGNATNIQAIQTLIDGSYVLSTKIPPPNLTNNSQRAVITDIGSSTVYGYTNNSTILQLPGQPGLQPLTFANQVNMTINTSIYELPTQNFGCGSVNFGLVSACLGALFGNLFYNDIFVVMYNFFLNLFGSFINQTITAFLMMPLAGMSAIFNEGVKIISTPGINPVIALANMGTYYINFAVNLWLQLIEISIVATLIPIFGIFVFPLIALATPVLMAWLGIMLQIGFTTAYYVPILPYVMFTFGAVSWLMAVIEAMVAAPIVALGVTHPEGHDAFGKGEGAIMILLNVFLRPAMMIIGYIAAITLTYVSVWIINAGFDNAIGFIQGSSEFDTVTGSPVATQGAGTITGGYNSWAGVFAYFFSILIYTMLYLTVVQKSFTLISALPDKVLRWIGGQQESYGAETAQWGQEMQGKIAEGGKETATGQAQLGKQMQGYVGKGMAKGKKGMSESGGGGAEFEGTPGSTPSPADAAGAAE
jgi:defect in organelle trafficking protein DotA